MTELAGSEWIQNEDGTVAVRCPANRAWTLLIDGVEAQDGTWTGRVFLERPDYTWDAQVKLLAKVEEVAEGGTLGVSVSETINLKDRMGG